jgi:ProP effector
MSVTDTPSNEAQGPVEDPAAAPAAVNESTTALPTDSRPPISADEPAAGEPCAEPAVGEPPAFAAPREQGLSPAQTAARLAELFPALFGSTPKPIKLRIQVDIQQRAPGIFTKRVMSIVLSRHTTTTPYLKALVAETQRYDLDGQPAGEIAAEHKQAAVDELARRRQIVEERRAAERAARGPRPGRGPQRPAGEPAPEGSGPMAPEGTTRPDRPPRPPRQTPERGPSAGFAGDRRPRQERQDRPGRPGERTAGPRPQGRSDGPRGRPHEAEHRPRQPNASPHGTPPGQRNPGPRSTNAGSDAQAQRDWTPVDPAQRERAVLLRAWENSSLTKANFCALKRMTAAEFDAQLDQARQERSAARSV